MPPDQLIALGSNQASSEGGPENTLRAALVQLQDAGAAIRAVSRYYSTPAFPAGAGPDFVNAAAVIRAPWQAPETLAVLHRIEDALGRTRTTRWAQRKVDLDLLACGDQVLPDATQHAHWRDLPLAEQMQKTPQSLILPHPRLQDRAFVLVPLADVAPDWRHPLLGKTVRQMRDALAPDLIAEVRPITPGSETL